MLREEITACRRCPRLVRCRERLATEKNREFRSETYWGKGVPGFGDPSARLVVIGLAPSAQGSNRTGRMFTGDRSAAFLVRALYATGFASQPTSLRRGDGLAYHDLYLTAAVRCVPPDNRPLPDEKENCRPYLEREFRLLRSTRAYLALGGFAWDATLDSASRAHGVDRPRSPFAHGACAVLGPGKPLVFASYHPSPQNTNTGRLTGVMFEELLGRIRAAFDPGGSPGKAGGARGGGASPPIRRGSPPGAVRRSI
ncbi:MAG: uracil-DNA glycosylase [Thermoplasmata archaeon]|nr:uracil-DNA glycosylase [Thermoplasmata archaeon]